MRKNHDGIGHCLKRLRDILGNENKARDFNPHLIITASYL